MGRLESATGTGEIDLTMSDTELADSPSLVEFLEAASAEWSDLPYLGIHSVMSRSEDLDAALDGTFRLRDERFTLSPPGIDWWDAPYRGANERGFFQNSFVFADPLLLNTRFPEVLAPLAAIFADWLAANPRTGSRHPHRYAWHDHAAAGRIVPMAFVLREGIRRGSLDRATVEVLASGVREHARYLLAEENYAAHNNHGFASDAALIIIGHSLAPAPEARRWIEVAERRFGAVLDHMIDRKDAIHLEHSPAYHWNIHDALGRFAAAGMFDGLDLPGLINRMKESGAWLITPDGTLPPLGDTPVGEQPPAAAARIAAGCVGLKVFRGAGYAVVRERDSALFVTAAHHPTAHKHADDGSFCLYEDGRAVVLDSGNPGYEYDSAEFRYGTSPAAHATISVDGFDWAKEGTPYGSGLLASAQQDHLYALLIRNPHAVPGGGAALRVLVYAPKRFLLVIDDVEATGEHQLSRHLPLAPELEARPIDGGGVEIREGNSTLALLVQIPAAKEALDDVEIVFGRRQPKFQGFRFITPEEPCASHDVTLSGAGGQPRALALVLDQADHNLSPAMTWDSSKSGVDIAVTGLTDSALMICLGEDSIALEPTG